MKKLFLLFALFGVLAVGCEELFPTEQSSNTTPIFRIDGEGEYIVGVKGEEIAVMVTTNIDYSVVIPEDAKDWLSVAYTRSETREEILVFVVARNDNFEERRAEVELVDANGEALETLSFVQDGLSKIFETNSEEFYFFEPEGSSVTIDVTTNLEYSVVIDQDVQSWLSVADTRATLREETLTFTATPNDTDKLRYAFVKLVDADKSILQEIPFLQNAITQSDSSCPNDEIWYTTTDGNALTLNEKSQFNVSVLSNTYIDGKGVIKFDGDLTEIGVESFYNCSTLSTVHLPKSLKKSGHLAFGECWNLTGVYIYDLAAWCNIDFENLATETIYLDANPLCYAKNLYLNGELVTDLVIPEGVSEVKLIAFIRCNSITSVTIPDSVTSIDSCAFYECENLAKVTIPDSVTTIGDHAFCLCGSLTDVTIGDSVTMIGDYAFYECENLAKVTIPDSVTTIGDYSFWGCSSLTSVTIPDSVTVIEDYTLYGCSSLTTITIGDSVTTIGDYAFCACSSLTTITIGDSVTTIGDHAFLNCHSLTSVTIPDSVAEIGDYAFSGCSIKNVTIPDSVTTIGEGAFWGCTSLTSVTIPDSVTVIGDSAFIGCSSLTSVTIPDSVTTIGNGAFWNCSSLTSVTIPDSVTSIGNDAFRYCSSLEDISFGSSIEIIGERAFGNCGALKAVYISNLETWCNIDFIIPQSEDSPFFDFSANPLLYAHNLYLNDELVTNIVIPEHITNIKPITFVGCKNITSLTIHSNVNSIDRCAFFYCEDIDSLYSSAIAPPILQGTLFINNSILNVNCKIYVPAESYWDYISAENWADYAANIMSYDYNNNSIVESEASDDTTRWLGKWSSTVNRTYCVDTGFNDEPVNFEINIEHNTIAPNLVKIYGLSVVDPTIAVDGFINKNGDLEIINFNYIGNRGEMELYMLAVSESYYIAYKRHAVYTMSMDNSGNVSCEVGSCNGSPYIMFDVAIYNRSGHYMESDNQSLSHYSGPMSWVKIADEATIPSSCSTTLLCKTNSLQKGDAILRVVK